MTKYAKNSRPVHCVMLAGSAAVGKTTLAAEIKALGESDGYLYDVTILGSPVRKTTGDLLGRTSEASAASVSIEDRQRLQAALAAKYYEQVIAALNTLADNRSGTGRTQILVVDRSPFDIASYSIVAFPDWRMADVVTCTRYAEETLSSVFDFSKKGLQVHLALYQLRYPGWWAATQEGKDAGLDGFRTNSAARNFVWDLVLAHQLRSFTDRHVFAEGGRFRHDVFSTQNKENPAERATRVLQGIIKTEHTVGRIREWDGAQQSLQPVVAEQHRRVKKT